MTPRQVKRLREKILSEGYYRDRMYEMAELKADYSADLFAPRLKAFDGILWPRLVERYARKTIWYAKKLWEQYEIHNILNALNNNDRRTDTKKN